MRRAQGGVRKQARGRKPESEIDAYLFNLRWAFGFARAPLPPVRTPAGLGLPGASRASRPLPPRRAARAAGGARSSGGRSAEFAARILNTSARPGAREGGAERRHWSEALRRPSVRAGRSWRRSRALTTKPPPRYAVRVNDRPQQRSFTAAQRRDTHTEEPGRLGATDEPVMALAIHAVTRGSLRVGTGFGPRCPAVAIGFRSLHVDLSVPATCPTACHGTLA
jgi:hypothetical protein